MAFPTILSSEPEDWLTGPHEFKAINTDRDVTTFKMLGSRVFFIFRPRLDSKLSSASPFENARTSPKINLIKTVS